MREIRPFPLINKNKKYILFTNAKCGGTILKSWFLGTLDLEENYSNFTSASKHFGLKFVLNWYRHYFKFINGSKILKEDKYLRRFIKDYRTALKDFLPDVLDKSDWFKFMVVRNPYDRLVSAFVDKFCGRDLHKKFVQRVLREADYQDADGNLEMSFAQFVDYLSRQDIDSVNPHWRRQSCIIEYVKLDRIIDLKQLSKDLPEIEKQLGLTSNLNLQSRRQSNIYTNDSFKDLKFAGNISNTQLIEYHKRTNSFPSKGLFYNDELRSKVQKIYQADFDQLPFDYSI